MEAPFHRIVFLILPPVIFLVGCATPAALRRQTVLQADTVADIHQQQVLDNLAKFVYDPYAIPSFALASTGSTDVTDRGGGSVMLNLVRAGFDSVGLAADGSREQKLGWTVSAIHDPRKLELMRCAYQRSLADCIGFGESTCCPDCRKRFNEFYTGYPYQMEELESTNSQDKKQTNTCYECDDTGRLSNLVPQPCEDPRVCESESHPGAENQADNAPASGIAASGTVCHANGGPSPGVGPVNSRCLEPPCGCWLRWGCKKCVPKECGYVGNYGNTYVWVPPGPGREQLAKLTLAILDYAVYEDRTLPTKQVVAYLSKHGEPSTLSEASFVITALIGADESSASVIKDEVPAAPVRSTTDADAEHRLGQDIQRELMERLESFQVQQRDPTAGETVLSDEEIAVLLKHEFKEIDLPGRAALERARAAPALRANPPQRTPLPDANIRVLQRRLETER